MTRPTRAATAAIALVLLAACGGDDDADVAVDEPPVAATDDGAAGATDVGPAVPGDGPDATIAPDLPEQLVGAVGPIEVVGDRLPSLGGLPVEADPARGTAAPVLVGRTFGGDTVRIDAAANGPTMVVFLAHWCPHCNSEVPRINTLRDEGRLPADLTVVGLSTAPDPSRPNFPPGEWLADLDWTFAAVPDSIDVERSTLIAADAFGVDGFPFVTLIDADGNVAARWSGEHAVDELEQLITSNLGT